MRFRDLLLSVLLGLLCCGCEPTEPNRIPLALAEGVSADLTRGFDAAVEGIRGAQQSTGAWACSITDAERFAWQRPEINIWVQSELIQLLEPIVDETGLAGSLERARDYLRSQIQPTGLVVFNRVDVLLPPDSDDTAMTWIAAPGDTALIDGVLKTYERHKDSRGLYHTWLIDGGIPDHPARGDDPNPVDFVLQMHIYVFLERYAPDRAAALCTAMRDNFSDAPAMAYYEYAPWVYLVREADLEGLGCALRRPSSLERKVLPGQAPYFEMARLLSALLRGEDPAGLGPQIVRNLDQVAKNDFAMLDSDPLMFFHNDTTTKYPRYYWSKELGQALWLRLNAEAGRRYADWPGPRH